MNWSIDQLALNVMSGCLKQSAAAPESDLSWFCLFCCVLSGLSCSFVVLLSLTLSSSMSLRTALARFRQAQLEEGKVKVRFCFVFRYVPLCVLHHLLLCSWGYKSVCLRDRNFKKRSDSLTVCLQERRPFLASECSELPKAEKWRRQVHTLKCTLWSAHSEVHTLKCTLGIAHSELHALKCNHMFVCFRSSVRSQRRWLRSRMVSMDLTDSPGSQVATESCWHSHTSVHDILICVWYTLNHSWAFTLKANRKC